MVIYVFWNNSNGTCQQAIKTDSQISSILWSSDYKQIVTGQGHPNNYIHIWHYPSMEKCHTLQGRKKDFSFSFFLKFKNFRSYITNTFVNYGS